MVSLPPILPPTPPRKAEGSITPPSLTPPDALPSTLRTGSIASPSASLTALTGTFFPKKALNLLLDFVKKRFPSS